MAEYAEEHLTNLDRLDNRAAKRAYLAIVLAAERAGYRVVAGAKGFITTNVRMFGRDEQQPYAFIVNISDLLFYIRNPAINKNPDLRVQAADRFGDKLLTKTNSLDEPRIRIADASDAATLIEWLFS